jgi:hypothetical protein
MNLIENKWSQKEEELLRSGMKPLQLSKHPLMVANNRTYGGIKRKLARIKENALKPPKPPKPEKVHIKAKKPKLKAVYEAKEVELYQFITLAEATPERTKQW